MVGVPIRQGEEIHREDGHVEMDRLELHCHTPRNAQGYQSLEEGRKSPPPEVSEGVSFRQNLDFRLPALRL